MRISRVDDRHATTSTVKRNIWAVWPRMQCVHTCWGSSSSSSSTSPPADSTWKRFLSILCVCGVIDTQTRTHIHILRQHVSVQKCVQKITLFGNFAHTVGSTRASLRPPFNLVFCGRSQISIICQSTLRWWWCTWLDSRCTLNLILRTILIRRLASIY